MKRSIPEINAGSMADIAFLLLIFFMSTTQFKPPEHVAVRLPASTSEIHVPETNTIILTVNREGRMFISSEAGTDIQEVGKPELNTYRHKPHSVTGQSLSPMIRAISPITARAVWGS